MVVTPHLGASTAEATDRAGYQAAEQVVAALTGGAVTTAVNLPAVAAGGHGGARPVPAAGARPRPDRGGAGRRPPIDGVEVEYLGRIADRDTRPLTVQVLKGALSGHTEEDVNDVNAPGIAAERGIEVAETRRSEARDFADLVRVTVGERRRAHAGGGHGARQPQPAAPARGVGLALQRAARWTTSPSSATATSRA